MLDPETSLAIHAALKAGDGIGVLNRLRTVSQLGQEISEGSIATASALERSNPGEGMQFLDAAGMLVKTTYQVEE